MSNSSYVEQDRYGKLRRPIEVIGHVVQLLCLLLMCVTVIQVIARYVFAHGFVALEELQWHLYAMGFLAGLSYCAVNDGHIRMDLIYRRFSDRTKAWLELFSGVCLVMPFVGITLIHSFEFFYDAWQIGERSQAPLGLPFLWFIKGMLPLGLLLLGLAGVYRILLSIAVLTGGELHDH